MSSFNLLSHAISGVSRPLHARISQVVSSLARRADDDDDEDVAVVVPGGHHSMAGGRGGGRGGLDEEAKSSLNRLASLYNLCGLLLFYRSAFEKTARKLVAGDWCGETPPPSTSHKLGMSTLGKSLGSNPLVDCAHQCLIEAAQAYSASLRVYASVIGSGASDENGRRFHQGSGGINPSDLARAAVVRICEVRSASPGFGADVGMMNSFNRVGGNPEDTAALCASVSSLSLEVLVDTLLEPAIASFATLDDAVALKYAAASAKRAGLGSDCYARWDSALTAKEKWAADVLIRAKTRHVLHECGLGPVHEALGRVESEDLVEGQVVASHPGLSQREVEAATKEFYASLYSPPLPSFEGIKDPLLRKYVRGKTADAVADAYRSIYLVITDEQKGGYDDLSFLGHDPDQVKTLLSL